MMIRPIGALSFSALYLSLAACGGPRVNEASVAPVASGTSTLSPDSSLAPEALPFPKDNPGLRAFITPSHLGIELWTDPSLESFRGRVELDATLLAKEFYLHANPKIRWGTMKVLEGSKETSLEPMGQKDDLWKFRVPKFSSPFKGRLLFEYEMPYSTDLYGLYKTMFEGRPYLFTQLESHFARKVFPHLDDPGVKIPIKLFVNVPGVSSPTAKTMEVVSNAPLLGASHGTSAPIVGQKDLAPSYVGKHEEVPTGWGWVRYEFKETSPLPSYLFALAEGLLENTIIEGRPKDNRKGDKNGDRVPMRLYFPSSKSDTPVARAQRKAAIEMVPRILKFQEEYTATKYPYEKLDFVLVPNFEYSGMENAGLITLRRSRIETPKREHVFSLLAHEIAHQWFGDKVTMNWWDDLWLNEGFASWFEEKTLRALEKPLLPSRTETVRLLEEERLTTFGSVRHPIEEAKDSSGSFDRLAYAKGEATLELLESVLGHDEFRARIRTYVQKYSDANASTDDFLRVMATDDLTRGIADTMLKKRGVPVVQVTGPCSEGKFPVDLRMYAPLGSTVTNRNNGADVSVPICFERGSIAHDQPPKNATNANDPPTMLWNKKVECSLVTLREAEAKAEWKFADGTCPSAVRVTPETYAIVGGLPHAPKIDAVAASLARFRMGHLSKNEFLSVIAEIGNTRELEEVDFYVAVLREILVDSPSMRPVVSKYAEALRKRMMQTVSVAAPGKHRERLLAVLRILADACEGRECARALELGSTAGLQGEMTVLRKELPPEDIQRALAWQGTDYEALGTASPETLRRLLEKLLEGSLPAQEARSLYKGALRRPDTRETFVRFTLGHLKPLGDKFDGRTLLTFYESLHTLCSKDDVAQAREALSRNPEVMDRAGVRKTLEESFERASQCIEMRRMLQ